MGRSTSVSRCPQTPIERRVCPSLEILEDRTTPSATLGIADAPIGIYPQFNLVDPNPNAGGRFGATVVTLSTGNIVVTDPNDNAGGNNAGAVYLFNGTTGALISTLIGSTAGDQVGVGGVTALNNGNYVVKSYYWNHGSVMNAGAVTWGNGSTGISGVVGSSNSLVGSQANDLVGSGALQALVLGSDGVTALSNGNYVVRSVAWDNGSVVDAGAVTWGNGSTGISGVVSSSNSLVGSQANDRVGNASVDPLSVNNNGVTALNNGNYVVRSVAWDNGSLVDAGAVTWGDGSTGISGEISSINSLVGSQTGDVVGTGGLTVLSNGNYVVNSLAWDNGSVVGAGAVTWGNGSTGISGEVSSSNSLVGSTALDQVGYAGVTALSNGNYVVSSSRWDNGSVGGAGAVTWGDGSTGISGVVSSSNSLVGSQPGDQVGVGGVTALSNGNYVVTSSGWGNGSVKGAGAVTWGDGSMGISGEVSSSNSLVGSTAFDQVGSSRVTALSNGNYVVSSTQWDNGSAEDAGAVTWGNGSTGTSGVVSSSNSLVGSQTGDQVGFLDLVALSNGNYVVISYVWNNGSVEDAGAVTWGNGSTGTSGVVSSSNSLVGSQTDDMIGFNGVTALNNGNYVVNSRLWDNGSAENAGAVTWGDGSTGISGVISSSNSLVGSKTDDRVGSGGVTALNNGNYVVSNSSWDIGSAVTWGDGSTGTSGVVSSSNSLVGSHPGDRVGNSGVTALSNGNYVVRSIAWANGSVVDAGAVTWVDGSNGQTAEGVVGGPLNAQNSIIGQSTNASPRSPVENATTGTFVVGFSQQNNSGAVFVGLQSPNQLTFPQGGTQTINVTPGYIANTLDTGTAVTAQATTTLNLTSPLMVNNPAGDGGALSLQSQATLNLNADITSDNGALNLQGATLNTLAGLTLTSGTGTTTFMGGNLFLAGAGTGLLNVIGPTALSAGLTFQVQVNGPTPGTQHDQMNVTGTVNLSGAMLNVTGAVVGEQEIVLIANDGTDAVIGQFVGLDQDALIRINGGQFRLSYHGGTGNDVTLSRLWRSVEAAGPGGTLGYFTGDTQVDYVRDLYAKILGRQASDVEAGAWVDWWNQGPRTNMDVINGLNGSLEHRIYQVRHYYQQILGRTASEAEVLGWANLLQSGVSEQEVIGGFLLSVEFSGMKSDAEFVDALYERLLFRAADAGGRAAWLQLLASGGTRSSVVLGFLNSQEIGSNALSDYYAMYLGRQADVGGWNTWLSHFLGGVYSENDLALNILGSQEFFNRSRIP